MSYRESKPESFIRFVPWNEFTKKFIKGEIFFSNIKYFNDPFEAMIPQGPASNELLINRIRYVNSVFCCSHPEILDDSNSFILMLSHYSQNHSGLCIEFRSDFLDEVEEPFVQGFIDYRESRPALRDARPQSGKEAVYENLLLVKAKCWEYEKEYRYIFKNETPSFGNHTFDKQGLHRGTLFTKSSKFIKAIYLGCNASDQTETEVISFLKQNQMSETDVYKFNIAADTYNLDKTQIY